MVEDDFILLWQVSIDSCPTNCIHWVDTEDLPLLEFLARPQLKEAHGVFGGGWERPRDVFTAAKSFKKQLERQEERTHGSNDLALKIIRLN